jgi:hypothetical protein
VTLRRSARSAAKSIRKQRLAVLTARFFRAIVPANPNQAGGGMRTALTPEVDYDPYDEAELAIQEWRVDQLWRLGVPRLLAAEFAVGVDWHDVAALVRRGCPPLLALEIAR